MWGLLLLAPLVLACGGCLKSKVTILVNPDGSGHVVVSRYFGRQAVGMWEVQRAQMADMPGEVAGMEEMRTRFARDPFYDEKALKRDARVIGPPAKFVKARRVDAEGGRGSVAVYAFKDINDVCLAMDQRVAMSVMSMGMGNMWDMDWDGDDEDSIDNEGSGRGKAGIEFSFQTGAVCRLKILLPEMAQADAAKDKDDEPPPSENGEDASEDAEMAGMDAGDYAMMMAQRMPAGFNYRHSMSYGEDMMFRGLAVSVEVEVNGAVTASDAAFTNATKKSRFVLIDVDTSRKPKDAAAKVNWQRQMQRYGYGDPEQMLKNLHAIPGSLVEPKREISIAFK